MFSIHSGIKYLLCFFFISYLFGTSTGENEKYSKSLLEFLQKLPDQPFVYEEGILTNIQHFDNNKHNVDVSVKVSRKDDPKSFKLLKCTATVEDDGDAVRVLEGYSCHEDTAPPAAGNADESEARDGQKDEQADVDQDAVSPTEAPASDSPVRLTNEIQSDPAVTSGEQFVAIPRTNPVRPCVGCSSLVDTTAPGVQDLANLALRHLDRHEPNVTHTLKSVVEVERQVQVVNGVRYILTLLIDSNKCKSTESETCLSEKACKISVLEKPWVKLPDGSKFRAILANNCTEEWQFGDDGEVLASDDQKEIYKVVNDVQGTMAHEKHLTEDQIKEIESQIIPLNRNVNPSMDLGASPKNNENEIKQSHTSQSQLERKNVNDIKTPNSLSVKDKNLIDDLLFYSYNGDDRHDETLTKKYDNVKQSHVIENDNSKDDSTLEVNNVSNSHQVPGGPREQDPNDPKYGSLANESLQKYKDVSGSSVHHELVKVQRVATQVVAGTKTLIDFVARPVEVSGSDLLCHSEVWEKPWINFKEINVQCAPHERQKRGIPGAPTEQDPNDPKYVSLANESLQKYQDVSGSSVHHELVKVQRVATQVVAGTMTLIDFVARPVEVSGSDLLCHSEVWEKPWINFKEINVQCVPHERQNRGIPGAPTEKDPNNPKYICLAKESLQKYQESTGSSVHYEPVKVKRVTTQVVAGTMTRIDFLARPVEVPGSDLLCHSEVWEKPWINFKEINVQCSQFVGGLTEKDPNDPKYTCLANESIQKYLNESESTIEHELLKVKRVTVQLVSGIMTRIDFLARPVRSVSNLLCHSEVWEKPWINFKEINVQCAPHERQKRGIPGAPTEQDPNDPKYVSLANESLQKYQDVSGSSVHHELVKVQRVATQVVAGTMTLIDFVARPVEVSGSDLLCHSEVWEKPWINFKEINVQCVPHERQNRGIPGAPTEKDPNNPKYICLAKESLQKYQESTGSSVHYEPVKVKRVTTQVVAGTMTRIDFLARPVEVSGSDLLCHSEVWEQPWINFKEIKVQCSQFVGGLTEKDPNDPKYTCLANESIQKYLNESESTIEHELLKVTRVTVQLVSGVMTRIDFLARPVRSVSNLLCHSEVWEKPWINFKQIHVKCVPHTRQKRQLPGDEIEQDPNEPESASLARESLHTLYRNLAEKSMYKYIQRTETKKEYDLADLNQIKIKNLTDFLTQIAFTIRPVDNTYGDLMLCKSQVKEHSWIKKRDLQVECGSADFHNSPAVGSHTDGDSKYKKTLMEEYLQNHPKYKNLAEESMFKYLYTSGNKHLHEIVKVNNVTIKVVPGTITTVNFSIRPTNDHNEEVMNCSSKILKLPLSDEKRITYVNCWPKKRDHLRFKKKLINYDDEKNPEFAGQLAEVALKHIEATYPSRKKQIIVRIFSVQKQPLSEEHYKMKLEVGLTNCSALSTSNNCELMRDSEFNRFCRVNVWLRQSTHHKPIFRVSCNDENDEDLELAHSVQAQYLFHDFTQTHKPAYMNNFKELARRFEIFKENLKKIHELNTHERGTARYAVTRFADLTYEEFKNRHLGLQPKMQSKVVTPRQMADIPQVDLLASFDWRQHGAVTEVKNQGSCGSCWAFSVTGNIEGQYQIRTSKLLSLSEQELVDCDKLDNGCNGGLPDNAYRSIEKMGGLETEDDYPYDGRDDKCSYNKTLSRVQISGAVNISSNETDMAKWLVAHGPISIGINANAMQFYVGGVSHPWKFLCDPTNLDHGVLIVGYGMKDYPLFKKKMPYWIIKNSWGPTWGEQGYYRVYRGDETCGLNRMASSAVLP